MNATTIAIVRVGLVIVGTLDAIWLVRLEQRNGPPFTRKMLRRALILQGIVLITSVLVEIQSY
jgi:hypothetical protein